MGQIIGAALAMALFGALIAWVVRKVSKVSLIASYAIGVFIMTFIAPALYVLGSDGAVTYSQAWFIYAIGGVVGFLILAATARAKRPAQS